jgi:putative protease
MIVADLGVMALIRRLLPDMEIHVSTQAGIVSAQTANAFVALGAKRLVLARELTLGEIMEIRANIPADIELETFVHGSMCVSYSGRCMLSNMLTGRDANRGACTQPCRWSYHLIEEKRPDVPIPIEETDLGTFVLSSKDMNTVSILPKLIAAGIDSFKIEGRMKSVYYTAVVTNAYRMALDRYFADPEGYVFDPALERELESVSHREYGTGYYENPPHDAAQLCSKDGYIREKAYFAIAESDSDENGLARFKQKNKIVRGDRAELLSPGKIGRPFLVEELFDEEGQPIEAAPHPSQIFTCRVPFEVRKGDILRSGEE